MPNQINGLLSPFLQRRRLAAARRYLTAGRLLDLGCADGVLTHEVALQDYVGVDRDEVVLQQARARQPAHRFVSLEEFERTEYEPFQIIVALAVIEHLPDPAAWLRGLHRRLANGGRIVLTTPHPALRWAHEMGARVGLFSADAAEEHETLLNRRALESLAHAAGFSVVVYRRFLGGANQLCVMEKKAGHERV